MKIDLGAKAMLYPMPAVLVAAYDENGVPNAMVAAWASVADVDGVAIYVEHSHKTMANILKTGAFTVSIVDAEHMAQADYLGIVSGTKVPDKLERAGLNTEKSRYVDAPVITQLPLVLECSFVSFDPESELLIGRVVNTAAEEGVLTNGKVDPMKLRPLVYDPMNRAYHVIGEKVGDAYCSGKALI